MRTVLGAVARQSARGAKYVASQVVVSVATAICVAFITNAYLKQDAARPQNDIGRETAAEAKPPSVPAVASAEAAQAAAASPARRTAAPTLPKLEAVYIPTIAPAAAPLVSMHRSESMEPLPALPGEDGLSDVQPRRARLLGIPMPRFGAIRERVAALFESR